jgi:Flp pilus assembly protein TadG
MVRYSQSRPTRRRGVAATELAVLLPFMCFAFVLAIDYGRIFYFSLTVANCARNGAIYGSQDTTSALDTTGIKTYGQLDGSNLTTSSLNVSSTTDSSTSPTYVAVTASYPFSTITNYSIAPFVETSSTTLSQTFRMAVVPALPTFP